MALTIVVLCIVLFILSWLIERMLSVIGPLLIKVLRVMMSKGSKCHCYYLSDNDIKCDALAYEVALIAEKGFADSYLGRYYKPLSDEHLPLFVLLNWTRTVAEDICSAPVAVPRLNEWRRFFSSRSYRWRLKTEYIKLGDHEWAFLWGAVFYWICRTDCSKAGIAGYLEQQACPLLFLQRYFDIFRVPALEVLKSGGGAPRAAGGPDGGRGGTVTVNNNFYDKVGQVVGQADKVER